MTAAGAVVDTNAIPIDLTSGDKRFPSVGSNGTDYYVAWSVASKELRGARVLANGTMPSAPATFATGVFGGVDNPAVAFNGTSYLVAWGEADDIMATRVSPATGALLDTTRIAVAANSSIGEYRPAAASNGTDWLVAWDSGRDIRAARVAADGTVKDPNGITIDAGSDLQIGVAVAWAGSSYWVTWSAPNNIIAAKRVAADGTVMDATAVPIASGAYYLPSGPLVDVAAAGGDRALFLYPLYELARNGTSRAYDGSFRRRPAPEAPGAAAAGRAAVALRAGAARGGRPELVAQRAEGARAATPARAERMRRAVQRQAESGAGGRGGRRGGERWFDGRRIRRRRARRFGRCGWWRGRRQHGDRRQRRRGRGCGSRRGWKRRQGWLRLLPRAGIVIPNRVCLHPPRPLAPPAGHGEAVEAGADHRDRANLIEHRFHPARRFAPDDSRALPGARCRAGRTFETCARISRSMSSQQAWPC